LKQSRLVGALPRGTAVPAKWIETRSDWQRVLQHTNPVHSSCFKAVAGRDGQVPASLARESLFSLFISNLILGEAVSIRFPVLIMVRRDHRQGWGVMSKHHRVFH
jgi:hypothetical protein